jgi:DNA-binding NarL/FixJ family response regulator
VNRRFRVMLVEDHPLVRAAVRGVLDRGELEVVGEAARADEVLGLAVDLRPDVIVLDVDLAGESALPLIPDLVTRLPETTVVVLTGRASDRLLGDVVEAGARGFLTKDLEGAELHRSVLGAARGELAMSRRRSRLAIDHLARRLEQEPAEHGLTSREVEIMELVVRGLTDREIGEALVLSPRTVESHVARILRKLGARNRTEAAARYRDLTGEADRNHISRRRS